MHKTRLIVVALSFVVPYQHSAHAGHECQSEATQARVDLSPKPVAEQREDGVPINCVLDMAVTEIEDGNTPGDCGCLPSGAKRKLSPSDMMATVRIVGNQVLQGNKASYDSVSPDGSRYVIRLVRGDIQRNVVRMDLLTGRLDSLDAAAEVSSAAHLLSTGLGSKDGIVGAEFDSQSTNILRWIDNETVALLWSDENNVRQVVAVNLREKQVKRLTHSPTNILSFGVTRDGTLIFNAQGPPSPTKGVAQNRADGFFVSPKIDGFSVLRGDLESASFEDSLWSNEWSLVRPSGEVQQLKFFGSAIDRTYPQFRDIKISSDGRFALTGVQTETPSAEWSAYTDPVMRGIIEADRETSARIPLVHIVVDLERGESRPLWNAPRAIAAQAAWSPSGSSVLIAPSCIPTRETNVIGLACAAAAEVDAITGQFRQLPIDLRRRVVRQVLWLSQDAVELRVIDSQARPQPISLYFQKKASGWISVSMNELTSFLGPIHQPGVRLEVRQNLNTPPRVYAVDDRSAQERLIIDPNARLTSDFKLGRVERISGTLKSGEDWFGLLIYPADFIPGRRYPLIIQSIYGTPLVDEEFTLDGTWGGTGLGLGPSAIPSYPGQLLAANNIAVVQLTLSPEGKGVLEAERRRDAFESVAKKFAEEGLVDPGKVGLIGFSRNGYWVEYTIAHSRYPFAVAVAADNYDPSYFQSALSNWGEDDTEANGGKAFGRGLRAWIKNAPGFNADKMRAPLLMVGQSLDSVSYIMAKWEIFSRLRSLRKPVEMYLMPNLDLHPSHSPQNPAQVVAIQQTVVDWCVYWMTTDQGPDQKGLDQYRQWRDRLR